MGSKKKSKSKQIKARQKKKTTRMFYLSLITLIGVGFLVFFFLSLFDYIYPPADGKRAVIVPTVKKEKQKVKLYFSDPNERFLIPKDRYIPDVESSTDKVRKLVKALIGGPGTTDLAKTFPGKTSLRKVNIKDGIAYIDFDRNLIDFHPGGSASEMLTIYSLTNTITINVPSVKKVKILVDGKDLKTIKGHIDTSKPFTVNRELIIGNYS
ncbi:MAG: GerMN domain-containing protein [Thermodesulfobacteriota bacterium]|nr:GerMN domain-containing protein [Thermodesulfobacteriota bacterium]